MNISISGKTYNPDAIFMFLIGMFSTMAIITVAGLTVFTWLLTIYIVWLLITNTEFHVDKLLLVIMILLIITTISVLGIGDMSNGYKITAIKQCILFAEVVFVTFCVQSKKKRESLKWFFKGFSYSCHIQVLWCILQILLNKVFLMNLNEIVFVKIFHMSEAAAQYGVNHVHSGLHWHAANMTPILIFSYFSSKSIWMKLICVFVSFAVESTTCKIGILLCVSFDIIAWLIQCLKKKQIVMKKKYVLAIVCLVVVVFVAGKTIAPYVDNAITSIVERFAQINTGYGSSAVHFMYYENFIDMIRTTDAGRVLLGYGRGCSGYPFSEFNGHFANQIWVVESDILDFFWAHGLIGAVLFFVFFVRNMYMCAKHRLGYKYLLLQIVIIICGIAYNQQFLWMIFFEFMIYIAIKNPMDLAESTCLLKHISD